MIRLIMCATALLGIVLPGLVEAQQPARVTAQAARLSVADDDALIPAMRRTVQPSRQMRIAELGSTSVRNGDTSTVALQDVVTASFAEQARFANRLNRAELVSSGALVALPEVDDEVLVFEDAYVIRRSTRIIVADPAAVARDSDLYRNYLGDRAASQTARLSTGATELDADERAGLEAFLSSGVNELHPNDPLRAAAARGEAALLDAIEAGYGELVVEDTLIVPRVAGIDPGASLAIPTVRNGVLDLRNPVAVTAQPLTGLVRASPATPAPAPRAAVRAVPAQPPEPPSRAPLQPKAESSGKHQLQAEFLLGATRTGNFQWERKWTFPSGYFRLTLGAGYAFGYRIPLLASATLEPTRGYIQDYEDKRVVIGVAGSVQTTNGNAGFFRRAGLPDNQLMGGDELLLEANIGWGYKLRALWKTIAQRPYSAIGLSFSQSFAPPDVPGDGGDEFAVLLEPSKTKISVDTTFIGGTATLRFDGAAWGDAAIDLQTLSDHKRQASVKLRANDPASQAGVYPHRITMDPVPLRAGSTIQTRPYGVRLTSPYYKGRLLIVPSLRLGFKVGYKKLKREFKSDWIPLNGLKLDTGDFSWPVHPGTRKELAWEDGEKTYRRIDKPADTKGLTTAPASKPARVTPH